LSDSTRPVENQRRKPIGQPRRSLRPIPGRSLTVGGVSIYPRARSLADGSDLIAGAGTSPIAPSTPTKVFRIAYQYTVDRFEGTLKTIEFPDYSLIGDIEVSRTGLFTITTSTDDRTVSNVDTKEFAFGDFSENVGMVSHWRNIEMYFGYDAKPHSISKLNTSTILNWPDDRINDIFADAYGNVIAATFGGLVYHNITTGESVNIEGHNENFDPDIDCEFQTANCILFNKLVTAVKWGKNGIWYVGTTDGGYYTKTAGRIWTSILSLGGRVVNSIDINSRGEGVFATNTGIIVLTT